MNAPLDTLAFARSFEEAGFAHDQAQVLAAALGRTHEASREDVVTRDVLRAELAEFRADIMQALASQDANLASALNDQNAVMTKALNDQNAIMTKALNDQNAMITKALNDQNAAWAKELADLRLELVREVATVSKDVNGRLWSTIAIIAGLSTAISTAIATGVALLLKARGL